MKRKIPEKAVEIIKEYEGFKANKYYCPAGKLSIGYGHVIQHGENFEPEINEEDAEGILYKDLRPVVEVVDKALKVHVTDNQFAALVSFTYNEGIGAFKESTLLKKLNDGKYKEASGQFMRWIYAKKNGVVKELPGLVRRRAAERNLFLSGMEA